MSAPAPFPTSAVTSTRLGDEAAERIRRYILDNELTEGARLPPERTLAERLGTSRATVSQAVRMLAVMGLVDIRHGSGVYVRHDPGSLIGTSLDLMVEMDPASVEELAGFRHVLERALLVGEEIPPADVGRLHEAMEELSASTEAIEQWIEADAVFHLAVVDGLGNRFLSAAYESAHRKILSVTYAEWVEKQASPRWLRGRGRHEQVEVHRRILEAIVAGDRAALGEALDRHQDALLRHLGRATGHPPPSRTGGPR